MMKELRIRKHSDNEHDPHVKHINRQWMLRAPYLPPVPILSTILNLNIPLILLFGFIISLACVSIFALIFWSIDQTCYVVGYEASGLDITFQNMFALSAQTFTTVGYGYEYFINVCINYVPSS